MDERLELQVAHNGWLIDVRLSVPSFPITPPPHLADPGSQSAFLDLSAGARVCGKKERDREVIPSSHVLEEWMHKPEHRSQP